MVTNGVNMLVFANHSDGRDESITVAFSPLISYRCCTVVRGKVKVYSVSHFIFSALSISCTFFSVLAFLSFIVHVTLYCSAPMFLR